MAGRGQCGGCWYWHHSVTNMPGTVQEMGSTPHPVEHVLLSRARSLQVWLGAESSGGHPFNGGVDGIGSLVPAGGCPSSSGTLSSTERGTPRVGVWGLLSPAGGSLPIFAPISILADFQIPEGGGGGSRPWRDRASGPRDMLLPLSSADSILPRQGFLINKTHFLVSVPLGCAGAGV